MQQQHENLERIKAKIKKCLAIAEDSASASNEAATAIKQAQALMKKHNISSNDIELMEISEKMADSKPPKKPPRYLWALMNLVARVFGVEYCYSEYRQKVMFYGHENRAEIAAYVFDVAYSQIKRSRKEYLGNLTIRINREKFADSFCIAWVNGVSSKIESFALSDKEREQLLKAKQSHGVITAKTKGKVTVFGSAYQDGIKVADDFQLFHAANDKRDSKLIE